MGNNGHQDIEVVYANGVLRPNQPLSLPENTRLHVAIRRIDVTAEQESQGCAMMDSIRHRGRIKLGGWRPTRDEFHERR